MAPLSSALDGTAHKAVVLIERSIATLESYLASSAPISETSLEPPKSESIARKGDDNMETQTDEHANSDSTTNQSDESTDVPVERDD